MHRFFTVLTVILFSTVLAFAQGPPSGSPGSGNGQGNGNGNGNGNGQGKDDHDDNGPIQSGYAVITPSASTSSMVAFETFGQRKGNNGDTTQAGVLPPDLTTNALLFVDSSGRLSKNLAIALVNPNTAAVTVTMTLRKSDGGQLASKTTSIASHQQISTYITDLFADSSSIPSDLTGMLSVVTSGGPVAVIGMRFRGANFSTIPATSLGGPSTLPTIAPGIGGAGAIILPQFATGGGWATEIVIANTGTTALTARLDLFKPDGTALTASLNGQSANSFKNLTVPAGGVFVLAPRDTNGDDDF